MKINRNLILNIIIVLAMFISGFLLLGDLPEKIPVHWNIRGDIDGYMAKIPGVFFIPVMNLIMLVAYQLVPLFDPKRKKYHFFKKEWEIMQTGLLLFFAYVYSITLMAAKDNSLKVTPLIFIGIGSLFILLGNYLSKISQNYFIGIKVPWTLASEDNWNKTHRYASWTFVIAGLLTLIEAYFVWNAPIIIFGSLMLSAVLPVIYSFLLSRKSEKYMKFVYTALVAFILLICSLRLFAGEDDWICRNGQWVKHGQPEISKPNLPCR